MKVAVIGSGIAGLSAAWLLGAEHEVTLYEALPEPGMGAHGVEVAGVVADVPLRVFYEGYYEQLLKLYAAVGIETVRSDYSTTFCDETGETYYRYHNRQPGLSTLLAFVGPRALQARSRRINLDLLRYYREAPRDFAAGLPRQETINDYLRRSGYSRDFVERFLLPAYAGIGTCSYERVRSYPAEVLNEYMSQGFFFTGVLTAAEGTPDVVARLSSRVSRERYGQPVSSVEVDPAGVEVWARGGGQERYDHVVIATQANQALRFLAPSAEEEAFLRAFSYERSEVVMHSDPRLMPKRRSDWGPVNFMVSAGHPRPMATIWTNAVQPRLREHADLFQTWNPILEPDPERVISRAVVERPGVDDQTLRALDELQVLHAQPGRRLWFCGSYAARGIPLLESGVRSAIAVAERLGVSPPWRARAVVGARES